MNTANVKNRGYFKIEGAARAFNFERPLGRVPFFKNKVVLDIGSSTGGFTQYALDHGAQKVIAVEKGTNQMKSPLRNHPKVELHEKTDIFDTRIRERFIEDHLATTGARRASDARNDGPARSASEINLSLVPDVVLADVSFISLTKILKYARDNLVGKNTEFLVMLKPQFEATEKDLNNGIVKNETIRRNIIKNFEQWLKTNGFIIVNKKDNDLQGKHGNTERFYYLHLAK